MSSSVPYPGGAEGSGVAKSWNDEGRKGSSDSLKLNLLDFGGVAAGSLKLNFSGAGSLRLNFSATGSLKLTFPRRLSEGPGSLKLNLSAILSYKKRFINNFIAEVAFW